MQCDFEEFAETGQSLREYNKLCRPIQLTLGVLASFESSLVFITGLH